MRDSTSQTSSQTLEVTAWTPLKQWLIHNVLPIAIGACVCALFVSHDDVGWVKNIIFLPFCVTIFFLVHSFCVGLYILQICSLRHNMRKPDPATASPDEVENQKVAEQMIDNLRKENPSLSEEAWDEAVERLNLKKIDPSLPMEAQNELVFKEYLKNLKVIIENRAQSGCLRLPPKFEAWVSKNFWRTYFSIRIELLDEWTMKFLEYDIRNKNNSMESFERFEKIMDKFDFEKVVDFFAFKKFIISDAITLLWIFASIGDVYVFFKYLKETMADGPFFLSLMLSLLVVRIIFEYTVVLFSIANLTREVRDELRISNAKKIEEKKGDEGKEAGAAG